MNIIDNPPPLPDTASLAMAGRSSEYIDGYENGFASGVTACQEAMQEEIARLTEHLAERGVSLVFQGEQLQKAEAERDELRAKLQALDEQKPVGYASPSRLRALEDGRALGINLVTLSEAVLDGPPGTGEFDIPLYTAAGATQGEAK